MKKFRVKLLETVAYTVEVEAEDGDAAEIAAQQIWNNSKDPDEDFESFGNGVSPLYHELLREDGTVIEPGDPDDEEPCRTCGKAYDHYGDGYDGECPDCADKTANELAEIVHNPNR
jgi:hypothetical protein